MNNWQLSNSGDDLTNFINYSVIRFTNIQNEKNIIDIPLRKLQLLYDNSNKIGDISNKKISFETLEAFTIYNNNVISVGLNFISFKINEPSDEFKEILQISSTYPTMGMQEKFDALNKINIINYQKSI